MKEIKWKEDLEKLKKIYGQDYGKCFEGSKELKNSIFINRLVSTMTEEASKNRDFYFANYSYRFVRIVDKKSFLVIGDCPIVHDSDKFKPFLMFPISSSIAIIIEKKSNNYPTGSIAVGNRETCRVLNAMIIANATEYVYMHPDFTSEEYMECYKLSLYNHRLF